MARVEVDGRLNLDEFAESTGLGTAGRTVRDRRESFVMAALGRLPAVGDEVT